MRIHRKKALARALFTCLFILFSTAAVFGGSLQEDFDRLCVNTQDAESLSVERLHGLLTECDHLRDRIEQSNDRRKKVLLFRLDKCRNFLAFIVEMKEAESKKDSR